jgi:Tfp pilus assembly protein PilX
MILVLSVMFVTSLLLAAAFTAGQGEIHSTSLDLDGKKAYYAAEAGVQNYLSHLTEESNYLTYCTSPPTANPALNQESEGTTNRATIPGTSGETTKEEYAIELLPAKSAPAGDKKCDPNELAETMIEQTGSAAGTFRIESTGFAGKEHRAIVATFKNLNFVSYVWFTKYETFDPAVYGPPFRTECEEYWPKRNTSECPDTNFIVSGETISGPMHTEDHLGVCGSPVFGIESSQKFEFASRGEPLGEGGEGYSTEKVCSSATPTFIGTHVPPKEVKELEPPPGDEELQHVVESGYEFPEKTEITLEGTEMTVTNHGTTTKKTFPKNHLIYVSGGCGKEYDPKGPVPGYTEDSTCGNVYVKGYYTQSLTIASQNDIIIDGNLTGENGKVPGGTTMLGLVANNFVRVYHPVSAGCENTAADLVNPTIDAAILTLKQSIMVDNFECGKANLGSLNVYGAIASLFSNGATGVFSSSGSTITLEHGYPYNLSYDKRLQVEEPPHFLNPIRAAWAIERETLATNP